MKGLSREIEKSIQIILEGLNYDFFKKEEDLDSDKMKRIMDSKVSSFKSAKSILNKWISSPNAPTNTTIKKYLKELIDAGESAISVLRHALSEEIDYEGLDEHKFDAAIKAKPIILEYIFDLDSSVRELTNKLEAGDLNLGEVDFKLGFPERFARGDFYPVKDYYKDWHNEKDNAVNICPHSTRGKIVTLDGLNIQLPKSPKKKDILFHDSPKKEQYWRRPETPNNINPDNADLYEDYIKEEFRRRREGIHFMNNGKIVYLTGNHYFALTWCKMLDTGGYMDFRYAQLNMYYFSEACIVDSRCLGELFVKSRRTGFTYQIISLFLNQSTSTRNNNFGITSKTESDAEKAFLKYRYGLINLPFYFRPVIYGKMDSVKSFEFAAPTDNTKQNKKRNVLNSSDYLNTKIDYDSTKDDAYDGQALYMYLGDEAGKWKKPHDYLNHWSTISPTMNQGGRIVGKAFVGSTVGAMSQGGEQFKKLFEASDLTKRSEVTKRTPSGLYSYFLPAQDNMEAYTDKYGVCHKEKPKTKIYSVENTLIDLGSIEYLKAEEKSAQAEGDITINAQYRAYPRTIGHAFRDESKNVIFNATKLYEQRDYNEELGQQNLYTIGNFEWKDGVKDTEVEFYPNPKGRFYVSWVPNEGDGTAHLKNRYKNINDLFYPLNEDLGVISCDPFSVAGTVGSKGAMHGLTHKITPGGAPNYKCFLEYIARPSDETVFFEDQIKCAVFYGVPMCIERNRGDILRYIKNRGYRHFVLDRLDRHESKLSVDEKKYGGQTMSGQDILDSHMNSIGFFVETRVGKSTKEQYRDVGSLCLSLPFNRTIDGLLKFNPQKRTVSDETISLGLAIMSCNKEKYKGKPKEKKTIKLKSYFHTYSNKGEIGKIQ